MEKIRIKSRLRADLREQFQRDLNDGQLAAVTAPDGYNLILAGPGSGKTRVIIYRVAWLLGQGVPPESILLVTFTRRAAREMVERLSSMVGSSARRVWAGTFHHIGNRLLREFAGLVGLSNGYTILDSEDQAGLLKLAMDEVGLSSGARLAPRAELIGSVLSMCFNTGESLGEVLAGRYAALAEWQSGIERVSHVYTERKRSANCVDYDDLLRYWLSMLNDFPEASRSICERFRHLLVDELQDTNRVQMSIIETMAQHGSGNLTVVGDEAQSIYRFRGAEYENILGFPGRHPEGQVFQLGVNYRSTPEVVALTNAVLANHRAGFPKKLVSSRGAGLKPHIVTVADAQEEASVIAHLIVEAHDQGIGLDQQAVLYRNHHDSLLIEQQLVQQGIPYEVRSGVRFFEKQHVKDVLAYLRIMINPTDELAWRRVLRMVPGVGDRRASGLLAPIVNAARPLQAVGSREVIDLVPRSSRGLFGAFVADLWKLQASDPLNQPGLAIQTILQSGYLSYLQTQYEKPESRLEDLTQLAQLAARHRSLESFLSDILLAEGAMSAERGPRDEPTPKLVLSTIHQAKGLEWKRVYIPRLVEDSFPGSRALSEPHGEDEERRVFYVAVSRAKSDLFLLHPIMVGRGLNGPMILATRSRFLSELPSDLLTQVEVEVED